MKKIFCLLICVFIAAFMFAENNVQAEENKSGLKIELATPVLGMVGVDSNGFTLWYDFNNQTVIPKNQIANIVSENPHSQKYLKSSKFNYIFGICLAVVGVSGYISSYFIDDEKVSIACSSLSGTVAISSVIPLFIGSSKYYKAISVYNMEALGLEELK